MPRIGYSRLLLLGLAFAPAAATAQSQAGWGTAGSVVTGVLVGGALGLPAIRGDWRGDLQAGLSVGAAFGVTEGLKQIFPDRRPDGSDRKSFPSGHSSAAFAAAATIQNRYGWRVGIPAQALAAFVAASRVEARKHAVDDVLVGAAIGEAVGFLVTSKHDARVRVVPWGGAHGGGADLAVRF